MNANDKVNRIREIINDGNPSLAAAVRKLDQWRPAEWGTKGYPLDKVAAVTTAYPVEPDDKKAPFFSEAFLYPLLGKGDARTLLSIMRDIAEAAGLPRNKYF